MPGPISPLSHALRLLKVQLNQVREETQSKSPAARTLPADAGAQTGHLALQALRTQLRAARGADGKLPPHKALRIFVQAALVNELGSDLQLDPALSDLVERTCQALEQEPASAALLTDALRELDAISD